MKPTSLRHGIATVTYGRFMRGQTLSHRPPADSRRPSRRASEIWRQLHRPEGRIYAGLQDGSVCKGPHEFGRGESFHLHVIQYDPYRRSYGITTGDLDAEFRIMFTRNGFRSFSLDYLAAAVRCGSRFSYLQYPCKLGQRGVLELYSPE